MPYGGATIQTKNWIIGFENLCYKVVVVSTKQVDNKHDIPIEQIRSKKPFYLPYILTYIRILSKHKPELVYYSIPWWSNVFSMIIIRSFNIKIIQRISNDFLVDKRSVRFFGKIKYILFKFSLNICDIILCQNSYQLHTLKKKYPKSKIYKIINPFSIEEKDPINELGEYVAWVGMFQYQKNLTALAEIAKKLPQIQFKIAGEAYRNISDKTREAIISLEKLKNVKFVGLLKNDDIRDFLKKSFCLLNTSYFEGFSNTYLEAFSVGKPVVTRKVTDPDQRITRYQLGISVEEYADIPEAILKVIEERFDSKKIFDYVIKYHDPVKLSKQLVNYANTTS